MDRSIGTASQAAVCAALPIGLYYPPLIVTAHTLIRFVLRAAQSLYLPTGTTLSYPLPPRPIAVQPATSAGLPQLYTHSVHTTT